MTHAISAAVNGGSVEMFEALIKVVPEYSQTVPNGNTEGEGAQEDISPDALTFEEEQLLNTPDSELSDGGKIQKYKLMQRMREQENAQLQNDESNGTIVGNENAHPPKYSEEERKAAIMRYKSGEAYTINAKLREDVELDEYDQEFVDQLDDALYQLPTYEGTVYRNLTFDDFGGEKALNEFLSQHIKGEPILYEQFISCSTKIDGYSVSGQYKVHIVIDSKSFLCFFGYFKIRRYGNKQKLNGYCFGN